MRISVGFYGDYVIQDELPLSLRHIVTVANKIQYDDGVNVSDWPVWVSDRNGTYELVFWNPMKENE